MNAALLTIARWAHRHFPQLTMCIATVAGLGVALVVVYALRLTNDLAMNLTVGACMVAFQSAVYGVLVRRDRAVMPPPITQAKSPRPCEICRFRLVRSADNL